MREEINVIVKSLAVLIGLPAVLGLMFYASFVITGLFATGITQIVLAIVLTPVLAAVVIQSILLSLFVITGMLIVTFEGVDGEDR